MSSGLIQAVGCYLKEVFSCFMVYNFNRDITEKSVGHCLQMLNSHLCLTATSNYVLLSQLIYIMGSLVDTKPFSLFIASFLATIIIMSYICYIWSANKLWAHELDAKTQTIMWLRYCTSLHQEELELLEFGVYFIQKIVTIHNRLSQNINTYYQYDETDVISIPGSLKSPTNEEISKIFRSSA